MTGLQLLAGIRMDCSTSVKNTSTHSQWQAPKSHNSPLAWPESYACSKCASPAWAGFRVRICPHRLLSACIHIHAVRWIVACCEGEKKKPCVVRDQKQQ